MRGVVDSRRKIRHPRTISVQEASSGFRSSAG